MRKEFRPIENPGQYEMKPKNLYFLFLIMPWMEIG
jgi:hypothetical protein